jgi:hypothetical protein
MDDAAAAIGGGIMATTAATRKAASEFIDQQFDGDFDDAEQALLLGDELFGTLAVALDELKTQRFYGDEIDVDGGDMLSGKVNRSIDDLTIALYERRDQLLGDDDDTAES